jgi:diaminohydroxyphosphoribosylaminopyrimidine deaminase / 5-amino-6-(5-phosphoribosylamino)uracil reductase
MNTLDRDYMKQALALAKQGEGCTSPNPMVGCVIVKDNTICSEGYHTFYGGPHAELTALSTCSTSVEGATWYITMEPCSHAGKTPPCVDMLIKTKPKRVVVAMRDPNPLVRKRDSIALMREAGIEVTVGCLETDARYLNRVFIKNKLENEAYITLKVAQSLDGKIALASGESNYITNEVSRKRVHGIRRSVQGVLVGVSTVLIDNPSLDVRYDLLDGYFKNPDIIVFDSEGKLQKSCALFNIKGRKIIVVVDPKRITKEKLKELSEFSTVWKIDGKDDSDRFKKTVSKAYDEEYLHLLIEGGSKLYSSALVSKRVDECYIFMAPVFMSEREALPAFEIDSIESMKQVPKLKHVTYTTCDSDVEIHGVLTDYLEETPFKSPLIRRLEN